MKTSHRLVIALTLGGAALLAARHAPAAASEPSAADRAAVERLVHDFERAWNAHDMRAFAALFHDDADWVNWRGGLWSGRMAIYEGHKAIHETFYRNTVAKVQRIEALDFLSPTVAYVRVRSDMTGDERSPGKTNRYRRTMLLTNKNGAWLIQKGHNTRIHDDLQ